MQVELLDFLIDETANHNVYSRALIDNGEVIVRPFTSEELKYFPNRVDLNENTKSIFLSLETRELKRFSQIRVIEDVRRSVFIMELFEVEHTKMLKKTLLELAEFFRINLYVEKIFFSEKFGLGDKTNSVKEYDQNFFEYKKVWDSKQGLILTAGPSITPIEVAYAQDAARNGWNAKWRDYLVLFEKEFASYVGSKYAIATSSCTGALQISLMALGIGKGDEVLVPDLTWVSSATAILDTGATPVFVDVEIDSWNICVSSLKEKLTDKTKAIIPVHMYGGPARMDEIIKFARKHNLFVVEDAACAIGAKWMGKSAGTFGEFGCFSFQGAKLLVTGEGGMIVTDNKRLYQKALKIWDQGREETKTFWINEKGVKFKMSNVQAAIGLAQIRRADTNIKLKRRLFKWYEKRLDHCLDLVMNKEIEGAKSTYWMTSIRLTENARVSRDQLISYLKENNIDSRPVFPAISQYPIWGTQLQSCVNAKKIGQTAINLPSGVSLSESQIEYICDTIIKVV